jgi:hypothetical protein
MRPEGEGVGVSSDADGQTAIGDVAAGAAKRRICLDDGFDSSHFRHIVRKSEVWKWGW